LLAGANTNAGNVVGTIWLVLDVNKYVPGFQLSEVYISIKCATAL